MAEEKKTTTKKITKVDSEVKASTKEERKKGAAGKRIAAIIFWLLGITAEVFAIMVLKGYMYVKPENQLFWLIGLIVADLIMVIIGSQFWKKGNDIDPAKKADKVKFFLQNQMGLIVSILAFFPLVLILLKDKDLDPKTKKILTVVAAAALILCSVFSIDFNPASEEDLLRAEQAIGSEDVYWTRYGKSYHLDPECQALARSNELFAGSIDAAFQANRNDPCDFCVPQGE